MRGAIVGLLVLLALVSISSVSALSSTSVSQNKQVIAITTTDLSLLKLVPGTETQNGNGAGTVQYSANKGTLVVSFAKGGGFAARENTSITPDKLYFRDLFEVKNQSAIAQCVSVYVSRGVSPPDLAEIHMRPRGSAAGVIGDMNLKVAGTGGSRVKCIPMASGDTYDVDFLWSITTTAAYSNTGFYVTVEARDKSW